MTPPELARKERALTWFDEHWVLLLLLVGLPLSLLHSALLFHSLAKLVSLALAAGVFIILRNVPRFGHNGFYLFVGTGYLAAAIFGVLHLEVAGALGVFATHGANVAMQLWISARAVQAISLLVAILYIGRPVRHAWRLIPGYALGGAFLLGLIQMGWFPPCYIEGQGVTVFKTAAEYAIGAALLTALGLLARNRRGLDRPTWVLLGSAIVATAAAGLAATFSAGMYDTPNLAGLLLTVIAFGLVYMALVKTGLRHPYETILHELQENERKLQLRTRELGERVKELDCLYGILELGEKPGSALEEILRGTAALLAQAMQFPSAAAARIVLAGREHRTANYRETPWQMAADLVVSGERCGTVQVAYLEEKPAADEGPFLLAERRLLDAVAGRLGRVVERTRAAELLRESERKFRRLVEQSQEGITLTDEQGRIIEWNRAMEQLTGLPAKQALGRASWEVQFELGRPEERTEPIRQQLEAVVQESLRTGQRPGLDRFVERAFVRADGVERTLAGTVFPIATASGFMLASIARDVTESKQAEYALQTSETRFRRLFEAAQDGILILDADTGQIVAANPFLAELLDYSREEMLGKKLWDIGPFRDLAEARLAFAELQESGYIRYQDLPLETRAGRHIDVEFVSNVYVVDGKKVIQCNIRDITARKQLEQQLRQAREDWEKTFDAVPDLIAIMDAEHRVVRMNRAMAERLGCAPEACVGRHCYEQVHGTDRPPDACPHVLLLQDYQAHTAELHEERLGGDMLVTVSPLWGEEGQFLGSVHVARDITERNRAAEALRQSEEAHRRLFETMPQGVVYQDAAGAIVSANPAAERILGLSLDQMQGRTSVDPRWRALQEDGSDFPGAAHPSMVALRSGQPVSDVVMGVYNPRDEQTCWIKVDAVPLFKPGEPAPYQVYTTFDDITARRQSAETLRLNEQRLNSLLDLSQKAGELSEHEIVQVALEKAEQLTGSQIAYLHVVNPDEQTIELVAWSEATTRQCTAAPTRHYPLDQAGIWADCVRLREPVIHNDYQNWAEKKGYPEGHVPLVRHASVPIFDANLVALILGVGNKESAYDESDVRQLLLIGSAVMRILRRKRAEAVLQASLHEKVVLLQEVHHRVKNNLQVISSLLDMQAMTIQDAQTLQVLQDSRNRVRAMAFVHDRLYQATDLAHIDASDYLQSVAGHLYGLYAGRIPPVELHLDIQDIRLDLDTAIPCGLVVNELVSNALKYAFPPGRGPDNHVRVSLRRQNGNLVLEVQDNGVGLPAGLEIADTPSLGLRLVSMLAQQLRGSLEVVREDGTAFCVTFPASAISKEVRP